MNKNSFQVSFFIFFQKQPWEVFYKKAVIKNFAIFTGKHLCWDLFLLKLHLKACNFIKKRLQPRCLPVNIAKFLKTAIFKNINEQLPLIFDKNFNQILHE